MKYLIVFLSALTLPTLAAGAPPPSRYGQMLLEQMLARYPALQRATLQVGAARSPRDLTVLRPCASAPERCRGAPTLALNGALQDVSGSTLGRVSLVFRARGSDGAAGARRAARAIRTYLRRHILDAGNVFEPYPYAPGFEATAFSRRLVEHTLAAYPSLLVIGIHATPQGGASNVIVASNFGRIGKKSDSDDMHVIRTGKTVTEVNAAGDRLEVEMPLADAAGRPLGAISAVFAYRAGEPKAHLVRLAREIRARVQRQIPDVTVLVGSPPPARGKQ